MMFRVIAKDFRGVLVSFNDDKDVISTGYFRGSDDTNYVPTPMVGTSVSRKMGTRVRAPIWPNGPSNVFNKVQVVRGKNNVFVTM